VRCEVGGMRLKILSAVCIKKAEENIVNNEISEPLVVYDCYIKNNTRPFSLNYSSILHKITV
jgi:hypothetical protein